MKGDLSAVGGLGIVGGRSPRWRRFVLGILALAVVLAAGWSAWWYVLSMRIESGFEAWATARRAEGWTVAVGARHLGGWPLAAELELADVRLRGGAPALPMALAWDAPHVALRVAPFSPSTLEIEPEGEQRIELGGGALVVAGGRLLAQVPVDHPGPPWTMAVAGEAVHVRPEDGKPALIGRMRADATLDPAAAAALDANFAADRIELPGGRSWPLGERITAIAADVTISGPVPPAGTPAARAEIWRRDGGSATLRNGTLRWGPLDASADLRGGLDPSLQPVVEGTARMTGWAQALDVLAAHHAIGEHAALTAKAVMSLVAETPPGGGASAITIPFAAADGVFSVRGIPLLRLPPLAWPRA